MEDAFGTLVFVVAALGAVVAVVTLAGTARSYREIGGAGLTHHGDVGLPGAGPQAGPDAARDEELDPALRDEVRDLVVAGNHHRVRAGKQPLDVETEVQRRIGELT